MQGGIGAGTAGIGVLFLCSAYQTEGKKARQTRRHADRRNGKLKKWRMKWNVNYKFATHYHVNEVLYKWFRKKKCPVCGSKLIYSPEEEYLGKQRLRNDPSDGFFGVIRDTYMIYHR